MAIDWTQQNTIERQRDVPPAAPPPPPPLDFGTPQPPPYYIAAPGVPSQPPPQIVDRQAWLRQQQQQQLEIAQRTAAHFLALNQLGAQVARQNQISAAERSFAAGLPPATELGAPVQPMPLEQVERPQPPPPGVLGGITNVARGVGETLNTTIPGLPQVQSAVGNAAAKLASIPAPIDIIPGVPDTRPFREAAARVIGEGIIPTHVWDTALVAIPAAKARTPLELASSVLLGDTGAIDALRNAGKKLGESDAVERGLAKLSQEGGFLRFGEQIPITETQSGFKTTFPIAADLGGIRGRTAFMLEGHNVNVERIAPDTFSVDFKRFGDELTGYGRKAGGNLRNLAEVGHFLRDLAQNNPDKQFIATAADARLRDAYLRLGFDPMFPDRPESLNLVLNPEKLQTTMGRFVSRLAEERGSLNLGGEAEKAAQAAIPAENPVVQSLQERRTQITRLLRILQAPGKAEQKAIAQRAFDEQLAQLPESSQKLVQTLIETTPSRGERAAITGAQRTRQAAGAAQAFEGGGTETEKAAAAFKAMGGKQAQRFTPVGERFTPTETGDLYSRLSEAHAAGTIGVFDRANAASALNLLLTGQRLPGLASEAAKPLNLMPHEIKLLGRIFGPEVELTLPKTAASRGALNTIIDALNLPRAIVTAIDVSAAGRQGILLATRNINEFRKSWLPMFKAMSSDEGFQRAAAALQQNPKYEDALVHGLELTDVAAGAQAEEPFISGLVQKLPTWAGGGLIRGSERGFVMFLDTLRLLSYEKYANRVEQLAGKQGWNVERTDLVKSQVAKFLNHASGRGDVGALGQYAPAMNAIFFSPRFFLSRPQSVWDMVRPGADPVTRQIAFENLGAFVGLGMGMLATAKATGAADVELDPRSSDFGKMRFGDTRIDFWGGYQPIARYIAQFSTAKNKELFTGQMKYVYPGQTALRFFRSKLSPGGSAIYDYTVGQGKNYNGDDLFFTKPGWGSAWNDFAQRIVPLSIQDAIRGYQQQGLGGGIAAGAVSTVGGGVSAFGASEQQQQTMQLQDFTSKLKGARIESNQVWPTVLDTDFRSPAWQAQFKADFAELGDLSQYGTLADMRKAYTDYWTPRSPKLSKSEVSAAFDKHPSVKLWEKNVAQEKLNWWKANPTLVDEARKNDVAPSSTILKAIGK